MDAAGRSDVYAQLCGIGFLNIAYQSYYSTKALDDTATVLTEATVVTTLGVIAYNVCFALWTWPMRIHSKETPPINAAEKFFGYLAVATSIGMIPALFMK